MNTLFLRQFNVSAFNMGVMGYRTPNIDRLARKVLTLTFLVTAAVANLARAAEAAEAPKADPLASWNEGSAKEAIVDFVAKVTKKGSPDFVPAAQRIAVFDNDGTLWAEQPLPVQAFFALDRVKAL